VKISLGLRTFVLKTKHIRGFNSLYVWFYKLAVAAMRFSFSRMPEVSSFYIAKEISQRNYDPGISDVDIHIVITQLSPTAEASFLIRFSRVYLCLKRIFPILGEVVLGQEQELKRYLAHHLYPLSRKREHILIIQGKDCLEPRKIEIPPHLLRCDALFYAIFVDFYSHFIKIFLSESGVLKTFLIHKFKNEILRSCHTASPTDASARNEDLDSPGKIIRFLDKTCEHFILDQGRSTALVIEQTRHCFAPDTHDFVVSQLKNPFRVFYDENQETIESVILAPGRCRNYNYKILILLKESINVSLIDQLLERLKLLYSRKIKTNMSYYFDSYHFPIILTPLMFQSMQFSFVTMPLEHFILSKHAAVLGGSRDPINQLQFNPQYFWQSIGSELARVSINIRSLFWIKTFPERQRKAVVRFVDYVCGTIPMLHLACKRKLIVTSQREAYLEYRKCCPEEYWEWYEAFYNRFSKPCLNEIEEIPIHSLYSLCSSFLTGIFDDIEKYHPSYTNTSS